MKVWIWIKRAGIGVSLILNLLFACRWLVDRTSAPIDHLGTITRDIEVGDFRGGRAVFQTTEGLGRPRCESTGIGCDWPLRFEPHRFEIVVTTEAESLVDYSNSEKANLTFGELYSADWKSNHATK